MASMYMHTACSSLEENNYCENILSGPTISRNVKIHNRGVVNPISQGVISEREDENDFDMNQDSKFSSTACTDVSFEKNSFTPNVAYSANISQVVHPGSRRNTHLPGNILELNKSPNSPSIQEPIEADSQLHPVPPQYRKATLSEVNNDQSNFLKAWTTSVDQGSVRGSKDSLAGAGKLRDNTDKGSTCANKRKISKGTGNGVLEIIIYQMVLTVCLHVLLFRKHIFFVSTYL